MCLAFLWFWAVLPWVLVNRCGVFCVYGFSFRDFGFCIVGCTVCLATSSVIRWFESTRQPIEVRQNSLLTNIFSVLFFMFRLLSFGYWMDLLLLFPVRLPFVSINLYINLASEFLPRNYSLTSASHSILRGTFMNIKLLSWLKQGYICNIFAEMCTYITTAVHVTYYTTHRKQVIVCFHFF